MFSKNIPKQSSILNHPSEMAPFGNQWQHPLSLTLEMHISNVNVNVYSLDKNHRLYNKQ